MNWRKSSFSYANGNCVEVGGGMGRVLVRDTKDRDKVVLAFSAGAWRAFSRRVRSRRATG
jgi:Domain of unknown function (DUF397)